MDSKELRDRLLERLTARLLRMGLTSEDMTDDLDLVRSGVLDSLGFVDLIADLSNSTGRDVDLEAALDRKGATTVGGVLALFR